MNLRKNHRTVFFFVGCILALWIAGCTHQPETAASSQVRTPSQPPAPTVRELTKDQIRSCIYEGGNNTLEPSPIFATSGDIRPVWIVTGKVENKCDYALKSVKIRVTAYHKGDVAEIFDTADFTVEDVPARSVRAYRQSIQLMIQRQQQFAFYYDFVEVTTVSPAQAN